MTKSASTGNYKHTSNKQNAKQQVSAQKKNQVEILERENTVSLSLSKKELAQRTSWGSSGLAAVGQAPALLLLRFLLPGGGSSGERSGLFSTDQAVGLPVGGDSLGMSLLPLKRRDHPSMKTCSLEWQGQRFKIHTHQEAGAVHSLALAHRTRRPSCSSAEPASVDMTTTCPLRSLLSAQGPESSDCHLPAGTHF